MENKVDILWKNSFDNFEHDFNLLRDSLITEEPTRTERKEIIQRFEMTFELSMKLLKEYMEGNGHEFETSHDLIKKAYSLDIVKKGDIWIEAIADSQKRINLFDDILTQKDHPALSETEEDELLDRVQNRYFPELYDVLTYFRQKYERYL